MFNFFKKKTPSVPYQNFIWFGEEAKYEFLMKTLQQLLASKQRVVLLSFFGDTQSKLKEQLQDVKISYQSLEKQEALSSDSYLFLGNVSESENGLNSLKSLMATQSTDNLRFIFAEHYPAFKYENQILQKIAKLFPESEIGFYTALREPFFEVFDGERIIKMMQTLGMDENEMINHTMIDKSIIRAQEKIQGKIIQERRATSQKKWLEINLA